jgi:hypothetical protein
MSVKMEIFATAEGFTDGVVGVGENRLRGSVNWVGSFRKSP